MKRLLSLLIAVLFLGSACILAYASSPSAYFLPEYKTSNIQTEVIQDFETAPSTKYGVTLQDSYGFKYQRPADHVYSYSTDDFPFNRGGKASKYLILQTKEKASNYIAPFYDVRATADGETLHYSFDILIKDFDSTKQIRSIWRSFNSYWETHVVFGTNGKLKFNNDTTEYGYSLNRWYRFDVVIEFDHGWDNNQGTHDTSYYMDGKLLYTRQDAGNYQVNGAEKFYAPSGLRFDVGASTGSGESAMYIDNMTAKLYASGESPVIDMEKRGYTGFDIAPGTVDSYGFTGNSESGLIEYTLENGVFGKENSDSSMKISADTTSLTDVYTVSLENIKSQNVFSIGEQIRLSLSYSFKNEFSSGGGCNEILLYSPSGEISLFSISEDGILETEVSSDSFKLNEERWYNIDIIISAEAGNMLQYTIYVNGIETLNCAVNADAVTAPDGICPESLVIRTSTQNGETYLDDMYVEYFTGTSGDIARPNTPITNENVELEENGKIFVSAGYNAGNLLNDTNGGDVRVLRGGTSVTSGTAEGSLVVTNGILPVFAYAFQKLKFIEPTVVFSDGSVDITAVVESNQSETMDVTLVAAVCKDDKVYDIKTVSETCNTGTTVLALTGVTNPDGGYITFFAIEGWNKKYPVFDDQVYIITADSMTVYTPEMTAASDAAAVFEVSDFNYDELSVKLSGSIGTGGIKNAALYVVPEEVDVSAMSDGNLPLYILPFATDENGKFIIDVKFFETGTDFRYGNFNVYVFCRNLDKALSGKFRYLSPQQILDEKRHDIIVSVQSASTWQGLRELILGVDDDGNPVNDNFSYINPSLSDYDKLKDKEKFFIELMGVKSKLVSFEDIASYFESVARTCLLEQNQNKAPSSGGGGGGARPSYGSTSGVMNVTPTKPASGENTGVAAKFSDMSGHWAEVYVNNLASKGIINGYTDGSYCPENNVTRAELAKIIAETFDFGGSSDRVFGDVPDDAWYACYVNAASANGIITGYNGNFNPDAYVTRQDAALMVYRAMSPVYQFGSSVASFNDKANISEYALLATNCLYDAGIIQGDSTGSFRPLDSLSRAEIAAIIFRVSELLDIN